VNQIVKIGDLRVGLLGDTHLGKTFRNGVPLHRMGEREEMVWSEFGRSLGRGDEVDFHVHMGDLFDKPHVPYATLLRAARLYRTAARLRQNTTYVVMNGNHDVSRDADVVSAFDLFAELVEDVPNIKVFNREAAQIGSLYFVPWNAQGYANHTPMGGTVAAFGHWDVVAFGDTTNMVPRDRLLGVKHIFTGHDHNPRVTPEGVVVVGSMQPFSFGEDEAQRMYKTFLFDEFEAVEKSKLRDCCVRVYCKPNEKIEEIPDCLQFQIKMVEEEAVDVEVDFDDFDIEQIFKDCFDEHNVGDVVRARVMQKYKETRLA
jgi:DNA repair exonuclease SbcCD nuclease subunit